MRVAYLLASQSLPAYTCKFSRHDYTLPQLFACLAVKELLKRSYRGAEAVLADADGWLRDVGLARAPDHNTLQRAAAFLLRACRIGRLLDRVAHWAAVARILGLSQKPLAVDSTTYESHHVSRHYERRCHQTRKRMRAEEKERRGRRSTRADTTMRSASRPAATWSCRRGRGPGRAPTTRSSSRWCSRRGGACPTARSRSWPTPATTRRPTTNSPAATWACGR